MEKLEACKKLSRLGWMSQACDNMNKRRQNGATDTMLRNTTLQTRLSRYVFDKLYWSYPDGVNWVALHDGYVGLDATIGSIE